MLSPKSILDLQRHVGNAVVSTLIERASAPVRRRGATVQRAPLNFYKACVLDFLHDEKYIQTTKRKAMGKVIYDVSMSLDGFISGANVRPEAGLGDGGERLHEWAFTSADSRNREIVAGWTSMGAIIVGRTTHLVPVLFGSGTPLFGDLDNKHIPLESFEVIETATVIHLRFHVAQNTGF